jgi:hypothetical protein
VEEVFARVWTNLIGRLDGPMHLRFIVQPAVALALGVRAALRDARRNDEPFLVVLFKRPERRRECLRGAWQDVGKVFLVAASLDVAYQLIVHRSVFALELLLTATLLALVPYALVRGPLARLASWWRRSPSRPSITRRGGTPAPPLPRIRPRR